MSDPEIARRCHQCGASVRSGAAFCPQCGLTMEQQGTTTDTDHSATVPLIPQSNTSVELAETVASDRYVTQPLNHEAGSAKKKKSKKGSTKSLTADAASVTEDSLENIPSDGGRTAVAEAPLTGAPEDDGATAVVEPRVTVAHTDDGAAKAEPKAWPNYGTPVTGNPPAMGRVEKLRKASSVVIDQAAYDPSLRFLLVAGALFLLFLILLVTSKILG